MSTAVPGPGPFANNAAGINGGSIGNADSINSDPPTNSEIQACQQALDKLEQLQAAVYKVRFELPAFLRGLAYIDERELVGVTFNRIVESAKEFNGDIDKLLKVHSECASLISSAKAGLASQTKAALAQAEANQGPQNNNMNNETTKNGPINTGNADQSQEQMQMAARNSALAAQRSIQNLIGGGGFNDNVQPSNPANMMAPGLDMDQLDDPILLDDASMNFLKF